MRKLLKASTRALICSTDSMVLESTSINDRLDQIFKTEFIFDEVIRENIPGEFLVDRDQLDDHSYQTAIHNRFNEKMRYEVLPFAQMIDYPEKFDPDKDKFFAFDNGELDNLERLGSSIAKLANGSLQDALALSDNNFIDALAMGISIYSWLGGTSVSTREDFDQLLSDISNNNILLNRVTESSIPKGDYMFKLRICWVKELWRAAVDHDEGYLYYNTNPIVGNQYRRVQNSRQSFTWPDPAINSLVTLSLDNSKTSGNNSKSKNTSFKKDEEDSPVEEMEM